MKRKSPRTVVVTGSSTGIGEAVATKLAKDGWIVFAGVRKEEDARRLDSTHANIRPLFLDVTKPEQVTQAFEQVRSAVGEDGLDALINNAGLAYSGPSEFVPVSDFEKQYDVNFFGMLRVTQAAMPLLRLGTPGRIANISSIADELNFPYGAAYCSSKAAVSSYTDVLRRELSPWGIKVTLIKPGPVETKFEDTALARLEEMQQNFPAGSDCHKYYGSTLERLPKAMEPFKKTAAPTSKVAGTIAGFLNSRFPRKRYYDTWGTYFSMCITSLMPEWLYNFVIGKVFFGK